MLDVLSFVFATVIGIVGLIYSHLSYKQNLKQEKELVNQFVNNGNQMNIHQDSNTGITNNIMSVQVTQVYQLQELQRQLKSKQDNKNINLSIGLTVVSVMLYVSVYIIFLIKYNNNTLAAQSLINVTVIFCSVLNLINIIKIAVVNRLKNLFALFPNVIAFFIATFLARYFVFYHFELNGFSKNAILAVALFYLFVMSFLYCFLSLPKKNNNLIALIYFLLSIIVPWLIANI